jgi:tetratricopeptide (TPR) repeat protein
MRKIFSNIWWALLVSMYGSLMVMRTEAHGDLHERIHSVTEAIRSNPTDASLYIKRGELYHAHEEFVNALDDYNRAWKLDPSRHLIRFCRASSLYQLKKLEEAEAELNLFLKTEPDHERARWLLATVLHEQGKHESAEKEFDLLMGKIKEFPPEIFLDRAANLSKGGKPEKALKVLDEGIQSLGYVATIENEALDLELQLRKFREALSRVDGMIARSSRKESYLVRKAKILEMIDKKDEAREIYELAIATIEKLPQRIQKQTSTTRLLEEARAGLDGLSGESRKKEGAAPSAPF